MRKESARTRLPPGIVFETDLAAAFAHKPEIVFHLAAHVSASDKAEDLQTIFDGTVGLSQQLFVAMVYSSCRKLIMAGSYWCFDDIGAPAPNSFYAACKLAAFDLARGFAKTHGFSVTELVLHDVYGPGDWRPKLLPTLAKAIQQGQHVDMTPAEQQIAYTHVDDVVAAFMHAVTLTPSSPVRYAVHGDEALTLREVAAKMAALAGKPLPVNFGVKPYPPHQIMHPCLSQTPLPGWHPQTSLAAGLRECLQEA